ncbi:hypothetical protein CDV49_16705 [Haematobacter genomosp. 1]|uniref:IS5/IS1182 family transposase n=1 Tax=Haematobacter genomosp. 1 TaxID=366618 RepID=A0A212A7J4_9RHOB|nr:hypothetical protein CDV49_16705 [Haematobacter genomosp. 1]
MSRPTPPTYKTKNWPAYNKALKRPGSLTIWFDPAMTWEAKYHSRFAFAEYVIKSGKSAFRIDVIEDRHSCFR